MFYEHDRVDHLLTQRTRALEALAPSVATIESFLRSQIGKCWSMAVATKAMKIPVTAKLYCRDHTKDRFGSPWVDFRFHDPRFVGSEFEWTITLALSKSADGSRRKIVEVLHGAAEVRAELAQLRAFDLAGTRAEWERLRAQVQRVRASVPQIIVDHFYARMSG